MLTLSKVLHTTKSRKKEKEAATYGELGPAPPLAASEIAAPPEARYYLEEELEEEEEYLTARAEGALDEASTDGEESEGELEMTEGEDNVGLGGNPGRCSPTNCQVGDEFERLVRSAELPTAWSQRKTDYLKHVRGPV